MAGWSRTSAEGRRAKRVCLPEPSKTFSGSGRLAPRTKHNPTLFAAAAMVTMQSDGRSFGPKPMTKKF
jgi:hypothetical protein